MIKVKISTGSAFLGHDTKREAVRDIIMYIITYIHNGMYWKGDVLVLDLIAKVPRVFRFLDGVESDMLPADFLITKRLLEMTDPARLGMLTIRFRRELGCCDQQSREEALPRRFGVGKSSPSKFADCRRC